ncbi:MAG: PASTA domain-containing protein [Clostridia bacterium]|nr:PASTA domain-containing protein [Clostridia bacterium]
MPLRTIRRRVLAFLFAAFGLFLALAVRLFWIQLVEGEVLQAKALAARTFSVPVEARRGDILDRRGRPLAISTDLESVWASPAEIPPDQVDAEARALAPILGLDEKWLAGRLSADEAFVWVKHAMDDATAAKVRALELPGLHFTREAGRVYPEGSLAANVLGFSTVFHSFYGVEQYYDAKLSGEDGKIRVQRDALQRDIPQTEDTFVPPKDGLTLRLTLDATIQYICERELEKAVLGAQAKAGYAVALDPKTGGILCLAQRPTFDPNDYAQYPEDAYRNRVISDTLSPGSTFKPITAAAALATGAVTPETAFYDSGAYTVLGKTIHNWNGRGLGATTFAEGFWQSANTIFARTAVMTGKAAFYDYLRAFGLTEPTGVDLPGEVSGIRPEEARATDLDLAVMGFGQTLTVTPIQLVTAIAAIANGGELMWPHVADAFLDEGGRVVEKIEPRAVRRVIPEATAAEIRTLMQKVVDEGTGREARIPCYSIGGKTGTTQKVVGGRVGGAYIASFVGFAPADDPKVVLYVAIDEPKGLYYGGQVAAPVFEAAMRDILRYLDVPPHCAPGETAGAPGEPQLTVVPSLVNLGVADALGEARKAGFTAVVKGSGSRIARQTPPGGAEVPVGTTIVAYTDESPEPPAQTVTVPDLGGQTIREAARILGLLGLRLEVAPGATGVAVAQDPPPGARVPAGASVEVEFAPPPPPGSEATRGASEDGAGPPR